MPALAWLDAVPGEAAFYADDLMAIRAGAERDGFAYRGAPITPGHAAVRSPSRAILLRVETTTGAAGWGDAVAVQYAGVGGRDLPVDPATLGVEVDFVARALQEAGELDLVAACALNEGLRFDGRPVHTAVRYGLSQAWLNACAAEAGRSPLQVLAELTGLDEPELLPVYAQSGDEREVNADRMILRGVEVLPHGLFNAPASFGSDGGRFLEYVAWLRRRVDELGAPGYRPRLHLDVYGMLGHVMDLDIDRMATFLGTAEAAADGLALSVESPCYGEDVAETVDLLAQLRRELRRRGHAVTLVADEFCNSDDDVAQFVAAESVDLIQIKMPDLGCLTRAIAAARACRDAGLGVFIGGSCAETEVSAIASTHVALAVEADQVLAKPGMGVDEGVTIVRYALRRALVVWERCG
ncbi:MAG: methylaspartate ammonia-lyase [Gaiellales bacterium]